MFSGTVLLAKDGKVLFKAAHGQASKRFNVPNRIDTKFHFASMNKMFTGVAIAQLVEQGKLSFDDTIDKFVSEQWLPKEMTAKIQIKHLLTHTSGLGDYFNEPYTKYSKRLFRSLDDFKMVFANSELAFEPGEGYQYSNAGMFLLGVVIENVTGQNYFDYVRENIFEPAEMKNTDYYEMDRPVPNLAIGYFKMENAWKNNMYVVPAKGGPDVGGYSTVHDFLRFDQALRNHALLSEEYTNIVLSEKPELRSPNYGYGFGVVVVPSDKIVGHNGGFAGSSANLDMFLSSGFTAVILSNTNHGTDEIVARIQELVAARSKETASVRPE